MTSIDNILIAEKIKNARTLRHALCDDLYVEMHQFLPNHLIINASNIDVNIRTKNRQSFLSIIRKYLSIYGYTQIIKLYFEDIESIICGIFIDYVINFVQSTKFKIDIFSDQLCICCDYCIE